MMHVHIEHPEDHTEREVGVIIGYTDPHEQTGSELETEPLDMTPHIPIGKRKHRWRMWRDEFGRWNARQPEDIAAPMFRAAIPVAGRCYGYAHHDPARVTAELQLAMLIARSHE